MLDFEIAAEEIMARCEALGNISQQSTCLDRRYLTKEHKQANSLVSGWMTEAGMTTWQDAAGNQWGRYNASHANAPRLIIGSHLDTVPNGGKYDGMLGVIAPISLIAQFSRDQVQFPFHIDVVGFGDEEGTRFGSTLLGSFALTGEWKESWRDLTDEQGISLADALVSFGSSFENIESATLTPENILGYLEIHIEQGPILENENLPIGIVSAIAGAKRFNITVTGMAGHAGTVPMEMRHDALCAVSEMILAVETHASSARDVVATVGKIENAPNGVNVISGRTSFSLDIRSEQDDKRDKVLADILQAFDTIAEKRNIAIDIQQTHSADAVHCDTQLKSDMIDGVAQSGVSPRILPSGAGHDAMAMASICPVAMLFTRCKGGISHHPGESITVDDVRYTVEALHHSIINIGKRHTGESA
ncbi:allantoate amidohydrolase [Alteromonas sp. KUL49]|uniref:allantoate amidohydrolase n=1 Tax=Alteromonas sp. KUL49 TaxID=2480798 RepID=UPI00102F112C|nr:allantoate amidohydrolase [Alteromonas sp. KUL49]TAP40231.1 allantoate amidohydrolase [Alteromonas sp. KUL49]GEA11363.1 Zn-dependent hydrolase [Alteromonas sp. KUL49]